MTEEQGTINNIPTNLNKLMEWDGNLEEERTITLERSGFNLEITVSSMSSEQQEQYEDEASGWISQRGGRVKDTDEAKLMRLYLYNHVVDPDLKNPELQSKFNAGNKPEMIVSKIFKAGELQKVGRLILKLSGFDNVDEVDAQIENLMKS